MTLDPTIIVAIASALVVLGVFLGSIRSSTRSAHLRLDFTEKSHQTYREEDKRALALEFKLLRETIKSAWKECPLARDGEPHHGRDKG
jgi:hypothetical protein